MPDQSRSTADIDDPVLLARAYRIDHIGLSAYFVALAAWQRGLRVTFHYDVAGKSARFENSVALSSRGEFFSVSDGKSTHFFLRTLGDLTSREISALCDDKQATKDRLLAAGVPVPDGILVDRDALDEAVLDAFLLRHAAKKFHIKPLVGSQSVGAKGHLVADEVCTAISEHKDRLLLVEEHVAGNYMRVNVVGGRFVGATGNRSPRVIGDGFATIAELIQRKNLSRRHTPLYKFAFKLDDIEKDCISSQGHSFDTILELGASALVKEAIFGSEGAESYDETATASREARELAIRSCKAMNVAVGGVDVLIDDLTGRHVVLEVNQCPMIKGSVFPICTPSPGNRVAEAIIDHYFPSSIDNQRFIKASFDFMRICDTLSSGSVAEVSLPVLGLGWVHKRMRLNGVELEQEVKVAIRSLAQRHGVYIDILRIAGNDLLIDALGPSFRHEAFVKKLKVAFLQKRG